MSWRSVQLGNNLCDQDQLIVDLFQENPVKYIGNDVEFARHLNCVESADNLILTINCAHWVSDILKICQTHLTDKIECVYLSINRYCVIGNDTEILVDDLVSLLAHAVEQYGFEIVKKSQIEKDLGRYFNFVQPLTWVYGTKITN
jgi:hypothetical protein